MEAEREGGSKLHRDKGALEKLCPALEIIPAPF